MPTVKSTVSETTTTIYQFSSQEILSLISESLGSDFAHPGDSVTIEFKVPAGGDYSGIAIDITEENPIIVTVERRTPGLWVNSYE